MTKFLKLWKKIHRKNKYPGKVWAEKTSMRKKWSSDISTSMDKIGFLSHNLLVADKASMQASLELRVPFLSENLISKVESLAQGKNLSKSLLLQFCDDYLPRKLFKRKKEGFNPPLHNLISSVEKESLIKFMENSGIEKYFNMEIVTGIIEDHFNQLSDNTYKIWQMTYLAAWVSLNRYVKLNNKVCVLIGLYWTSNFDYIS